MDQQPLTARFHLLDGAPGQRSLIVHAGQRRIAGLKEGDLTASKRLVQSAGRAENCVAFRHSNSGGGAGQHGAAKVEAMHSKMKTGFLQKMRQEVLAGRLTVNL